MSGETEVVVLDSDSDSDSVIMGDFVQHYDSDEEVDKILQRIMNIEDDDDGSATRVPRPSRPLEQSNCFNPNCRQTDLSEYIKPIPLIKTIFKIPKGKHKICIGCYNEAKEIYATRVEMLKNNEPLINGPFLNIDSVVVVSSDESDEDTNNNDEINSETKEKLLTWATESGREAIKKLNITDQLQHCNKYVEDKLQPMTDLYQELTKDYKEMYGDLEKTMNEFYDAYRPKITELPELDIPISDDENPEIMQGPQTPLHPKQFGRRSTTGHSISHLIPNGSLTTSIKNPEVGERVYYAKNGDDPNKEWVLGQVDKKLMKHNHGKIEEMYRIRCHEKTAEFVNADLASLASTYQTVFQYDIGTRVIAIFTRIGYVKRGFFPGMVGEMPSRQNRNRYLIFFECGPAEYVHESEIHFVYRLNKCSYEYFPHACRQFMKDYVESWPRRHMETYKLKEIAYVQTYGGRSKLCEIIAVDASLVNIKFLYDNTTQWMYRGSHRLIPMKKTKDGNSQNGLQNEVQILSDDEENGESTMQGSSRAVARKSVSKPPEIPSSYLRRPRERRGFRSEHGKIVKNYPANLLNPKMRKLHYHGPECVDWVLPSVKKIEKAINPLSVPSLFAFKREIQGMNVFYFTPCGEKIFSFEKMLEYLSQTRLELSIDIFDFDSRVSIFDEFVVAPQYIKIPDISMGRENVPIPCVNTLDESEPDLMEYMAERRGMEGVNIVTDPGFLVCCDCTDNCQDKSKCACWQLTISQARLFDYKLDPKNIGYKNRRINRLLITGIYECNQACQCNKNTCLNRVVQHPLKIKLQLYKTKKKGWGTRCVNDIPEGAFICVYNGDLLTESYANESGRQHGDEYFAELDYIEVLEDQKNDYEECPPELHYDPDESSQQNAFRKLYGENESVYIMDAKMAGNIGRYFNHSCDPNIFVQNVFVDTQDLRFPWVAFFSLKYIKAGTELTWNYGYSIDSVPGKTLFCYCEAPNCRKRLL